MTAAIGEWAGDLIGELGYAGLVVLMAVEHVFPPIPSELVLPLAGFEVGRGNLNLVGALVASTAGSAIGASVLYLLARRGGRPLILRLRHLLRVDEEDLDRAERRFRRHSAWMVVLGRMVPGVRSLVSLPPGLLRMPFGRYLAALLAGCAVWAGIWTTIGTAAVNAAIAVGLRHPVTLVAVGLGAVALVSWVVYRLTRRTPADRPAGRPADPTVAPAAEDAS